MRNRKFWVSAAAILLAGAVTAGLAARAVIAPPTGEVHSAGVVTIPSVLGQTAEEILFYPWAVYHSETLTPVQKDYLAEIAGMEIEDLETFSPETIGMLYEHTYSSDVAALLLPFELPAGPVECDIPGLLEHLMWNVGPDGTSPAGGTHLFLSEYPATLKEGQIPVTLSMASNNGSTGADYSFLIRPAQPRELTQEEQQSALAVVQDDLLNLLLNPLYLNYDISDDELYSSLLVDAVGKEEGVDPDMSYKLGALLRNYLRPNAGYCLWLDSHPLKDFLTTVSELARSEFSEVPSLDELLELSDSLSYSVQLITTQEQIVVLFTYSNGSVLGFYYDIQLGCYSGIGVSQ